MIHYIFKGCRDRNIRAADRHAYKDLRGAEFPAKKSKNLYSVSVNCEKSKFSACIFPFLKL